MEDWFHSKIDIFSFFSAVMMVFFSQNSNFTKKLIMYEASFSDVIRVVLIILLIYFGLKIIIRWFGPLLLKYILRKVGKQFAKKFNQFDTSQKPEREKGKVTIEKKPKNKRKSNNDVGEYIDYEEID